MLLLLSHYNASTADANEGNGIINVPEPLCPNLKQSSSIRSQSEILYSKIPMMELILKVWM